MADSLLKAAVLAAHRCYSKPVGENRDGARKVIQDPEAPATALLCAAKRLLGDDFLTFEPETLWQELNPPAMNRDKLGAVKALATMPAFYWDPRALGCTVMAFCNEAVFTDIFPAPTPEQLAWGVTEAELVFGLTDTGSTSPHFDVEAVAYVAALLRDQGVALAPEHLEFANDALTEMLHSDAKELQAKTKDAWRAHTKAAESSEEDTALGVQIARQARVHAYVTERLKQLETYLSF